MHASCNMTFFRPAITLLLASIYWGPAFATVDTEDVFDDQPLSDDLVMPDWFKVSFLDLQEDLDESEAMNDAGRAEKIREELDQLMDHLSKSLGIGGRSRKIGATSERARTAVTWRIRSAIGKIDAVHPLLAKHLYNAVHTGTFFMYSPEKEMHWHL